MDPDEWARGVDPNVPTAARMYDYYLGGSHNFAADRTAAEQVLAQVPVVRQLARANRDFLGRAVRYLAEAGVHQYLDIGSGIPTVGNVHEIAQRAVPDARVIYVDLDPIAVTHSRQILAGNDRATAVIGDLRRPTELLQEPEVSALLDFAEPVAVLLVSVLHFVDDDADPFGAVARLRDAVSSGSYLVISHAAIEAFAEDQIEAMVNVYQRTTTPDRGVRTRAQIERFFTGWELVDPGLVWLPEWRPDDPSDVPARPQESALVAGVARKT